MSFNKTLLFISVISFMFLIGGSVVLANTSQTSDGSKVVHPLNIGNSTGPESSSPNYKVSEQQVGDLNTGVSEDSNHRVRHGLRYPTSSDVKISFKFLPDGRYLDLGNNYSTHVTIEVRPTGGDINSIIFSDTVETNDDGEYTDLTLTGVSAGTYDITAKGWATVRIKKQNVTLTMAGPNYIDFSDGDTVLADSGDLDNYNEGGRANSDEVGDNQISAADYSTLLGIYDTDAPPPNDRPDLDKYTNQHINASDVSVLISNYGAVGD